MEPQFSPLDLPLSWRRALGSVAQASRILVVGPTDVGKSSFIRAALERCPDLQLVDLDPGQKMLGPPGTVALGRPGEGVRRMIFVGTTSASSLAALGHAAKVLASDGGPLIVNTAGFVRGLGGLLQAMTARSIGPDLIVEIGGSLAEAPILTGPAPCLRLERSPAALRKSAGQRRRIRQSAFSDAIEPETLIRLSADLVGVHPGPPIDFHTAARPICALIDRNGEDMAVGVLTRIDGDEILLCAAPPVRDVRAIRLGQLWAEQRKGAWVLLDKLERSWRS